MAKIGNFATGVFVLGALALLAVMLYALGMSDLFVNKAPLTTFFSESVQGLSVGAAVKYKGAQIGSVTRIMILPQRQLIQVEMQVEVDSFRNVNGKVLFADDDAFYKFLQQEIRKGLRCRLEYAGITGLRYLDLDYFAKPGEIPEDPGIAISGCRMPSAPSALRDVVKSLNTSLESIAKIRFEEISDNLVRNLDDLNKILSSDEIRKTITNVHETSKTLSGTLTEERLRRIVDDFEQALTDVRKLIVVVREDAEKSDLAGTSASIRRAADDFSGVLNARSDDIRAAVDAWLKTMAVCRELLDNLNRDPASVVRGRRNE